MIFGWDGIATLLQENSETEEYFSNPELRANLRELLEFELDQNLRMNLEKLLSEFEEGPDDVTFIRKKGRVIPIRNKSKSSGGGGKSKGPSTLALRAGYGLLKLGTLPVRGLYKIGKFEAKVAKAAFTHLTPQGRALARNAKRLSSVRAAYQDGGKDAAKAELIQQYRDPVKKLDRRGMLILKVASIVPNPMSPFARSAVIARNAAQGVFSGTSHAVRSARQGDVFGTIAGGFQAVTSGLSAKNLHASYKSGKKLAQTKDGQKTLSRQYRSDIAQDAKAALKARLPGYTAYQHLKSGVALGKGASRMLKRKTATTQ
jgi:hypothetical protein